MVKVRCAIRTMPFHKFNQLTGRLTESTNFQPFFPIRPTALHSTETPVMIYDTPSTKPVKVAPATRMAKYSTLSPKMAALYKKYQADLEVPSYLLAGKRDKLLFGFTCGLVLLCTGFSMNFVSNELKK